MRPEPMRILALCSVLLFVVLAACGPIRRPLLEDVHTQAPEPSPGLAATANREDVVYTLSGPARMSATIVGTGGQRWPVYQDAERPSSGVYRLELDGTVAGPAPGERRALPDGTYSVQLTAADGTRTGQATVPLVIRGADTTPPRVQELQATPSTITPNYDARADISDVTYTLSKAADVSAFADRLGPNGQVTRVWASPATKAKPGVQHFQWDGTSKSLLLPNGSYRLGVRAQDAAGNVTETSVPFTIQDEGLPDAKITFVHIGPTSVTAGSQVCVDATVTNVGKVAIRTQGPPSGFVYGFADSFGSVMNRQFPQHAGYWRLGLDWSGSTDTTGAKYSWRWGLGSDLAPGAHTGIHGCVTMDTEQPRIFMFAALVQEDVALHDAGAGLTAVTISH